VSTFYRSIRYIYKQQEEGIQLQISQDQAWPLELAFSARKYTQWRLNGEGVEPQMENGFAIVDTNENEITLELR